MSAAVLAASSIEELVANYRVKRLSRTQVIAALMAAGATAGGAAALITAVDHSSATPQPVVQSGTHQVLGGIPAHNQVALHARHIQLQGGGH